MWSPSPSSSTGSHVTTSQTAPPLLHSPGVPVPPPHPSNAPTSHSVTTTFPSFPDIEVMVPDPSPRSRTPRRDTDPLFPALIPESHPPRLVISRLFRTSPPLPLPSSPPHLYTYPPSPSLRPGLSLWQVSPSSILTLSAPLSPVSPSFASSLYNSLARLTIVVGPAFLTFTTYLPPPPASPFCALPFLPITGPACHCGRSRPPLLLPFLPSSLPLSPLLPYPLSPLAAPRAPVAMGDPKRSC